MHTVSANYTLPAVLNSLQPAAKSGLRTAISGKASPATTGTTSSSSTGSGLDSTFLNLLATELQNQDHTAPVDSTAMVGQMISLNQLDQLISINQAITGNNTGTTGLLQKPAATASDTAVTSANGGLANTLSPSVAAAAANQLPFDPNTMMPLSAGNPGAVGASINPTTMSSPANNNSGGK